MKRRRWGIAISLIVVILMAVIVFSILDRQIISGEQKSSTGNLDYITTTGAADPSSINVLIKKATNIIRAKVVGYGDEEVVFSRGGLPFHPVRVRIIDLIKGNTDREIINYWEPGGRTSSAVYDLYDIDSLKPGDEVILFLSDKFLYMDGFSALRIIDGKIHIRSIFAYDLPIPNMNVKGMQVEYVDIPVDDFVTAIREYAYN